MFLSSIDDLESKFKLFDRLNTVLFNVWRDKSAEAYKNNDIARITNEYRNYISQVRSLAEEASRLNKEIEQKMNTITQLQREVCNIALNPQIDDCSIWEARGLRAVYSDDGEYSHDVSCGEEVRFVAKGVRAGDEKGIAAQYLDDCDDMIVNLIKNL